jgi:hypothetical protein
MHITSEEGIYTFRKTLRKQGKLGERIHYVDNQFEENESQVCGIYFMTDPNKLVEIEIEFTDVSCELDGLLGVILILSYIYLEFQLIFY